MNSPFRTAEEKPFDENFGFRCGWIQRSTVRGMGCIHYAPIILHAQGRGQSLAWSDTITDRGEGLAMI
jgi:hypothetical protein